MKPDIVVSWPRNCDYPLWRQFIHNNRDKFSDVIVVFTETYHGDDYRDFVYRVMLPDRVQCIQSPPPGRNQDWRDVAVNYGLMWCQSDWIWFTEQDFYPNDKFWGELNQGVSDGKQVMAVYIGERMHPCSIFMERSLLNQTRHNFGIVPDKSDHFSLLQIDIEGLGFDIGRFSDDSYFHFNGLSGNYYLASAGQTPNYNIEEFKQYLRDCLSANVDLDPRFVAVAYKIL